MGDRIIQSSLDEVSPAEREKRSKLEDNLAVRWKIAKIRAVYWDYHDKPWMKHLEYALLALGEEAREISSGLTWEQRRP